jgi:tRNA(fMet)-specific endonuclease VapC
MIFLDTNICIYVMRAVSRPLLEKFDAFSDQLYISSIVVAELEFGVINSSRKAKNAQALEAILERIQIIPWDRECAKEYAVVRYATKHQPISAEDTMIAACAIAYNSVLVTNNVDEFKRVPRLKLENWVPE